MLHSLNMYIYRFLSGCSGMEANLIVWDKTIAEAAFWMFCKREVGYVTIGNPGFCLALYLTGLYFRGELQHVNDVSKQKVKCEPIRAREIGDVRL